jgi:hypothetical protein
MLHFQDEAQITCPYCGETITVLIDTSAGTQEYHEDCSVCCAPIFFSITVDREDSITQVEAKRDDQ